MDNPPKWLKFAPKIALAVSIGKMDDIYKTIAYKLNDKGNILVEVVKSQKYGLILLCLSL